MAQTLLTSTGIRLTIKDFELYFNTLNGGEITEYYDLTADPGRQRNLANINIPGEMQGDLWPLFTTAIYNPYQQKDFATGGYGRGIANLVYDSPELTRIYTASRLADIYNVEARNAAGEKPEVHTYWTIEKGSGLIYVKRTFTIPSSLYLTAGWRWYPFYFTRNAGFTYNGTFYFFNQSVSNEYITNKDSYMNQYSVYPVFPNDGLGITGIAMPFGDLSKEGDGTHNAIIYYNYNDPWPVSEWKSDTSNGIFNITWGGSVHEFQAPVNLTTHTYYAVVQLTHSPITKDGMINLARQMSTRFYKFRR
ncbi:MAG: hypothetical protein PHH85_01925 [Candidatus Methanoperedens sp.]|nr:hypothetical protein [Candidatus Methanoperedens sp.]